MDTVTLIKDIGLPIASLIFLAYGIWLAIGWVAKELVVPMRDRHFSFLNAIEAALTTISEAQKNLVLQQTNIAEDLEKISGMIRCPPPCPANHQHQQPQELKRK